ncbi:MAG: hypothetical protein ACK5MY_01930 [Jhaorihella sp.]
MKRLILVSALALSACDAVPVTTDHPTQGVEVMSRTWAVARVADTPAIYRAVRDTNNLNPYGPPAALRTIQAIRAIEAATGCRVDRSTLVQNISGHFFSQVACR